MNQEWNCLRKHAFFLSFLQDADQNTQDRRYVFHNHARQVRAAGGYLAHHDGGYLRIFIHCIGHVVDVGGKFFLRIAFFSYRGGDDLSNVADYLVDDMGIKSIFIADLIIDCGFVDTGAPGDFIHMRRIVAVFGKERPRRT